MNLVIVGTHRVSNDAASVITSLKDNMRKGERLTVAPGGSLVAIADSLGRVLLVDVNAVVVVRLWKVKDVCFFSTSAWLHTLIFCSSPI